MGGGVAVLRDGEHVVPGAGDAAGNREERKGTERDGGGERAELEQQGAGGDGGADESEDDAEFRVSVRGDAESVPNGDGAQYVFLSQAISRLQLDQR